VNDSLVFLDIVSVGIDAGYGMDVISLGTWRTLAFITVKGTVFIVCLPLQIT